MALPTVLVELVTNFKWVLSLLSPRNPMSESAPVKAKDDIVKQAQTLWEKTDVSSNLLNSIELPDLE